MGNSVGLFGSNNRLNFIRVDDSGEVGIFHGVSLELVSAFFNSSFSERSEKSVKGRKSRLGPDTESSDLSTWGKLFKGKSVHVGDFNSWNISESLD